MIPLAIPILIFMTLGVYLEVMLIGGFLLAPLVLLQDYSWGIVFGYAWWAFWSFFMYVLLWDTHFTRWFDKWLTIGVTKAGWYTPPPPRRLLYPTPVPAEPRFDIEQWFRDNPKGTR